MRILIIVDPQIPVPPLLYGGTERMVALAAEEFARAGHEVCLLAGAGSRDYNGGLIVHRPPTLARLSRIYRKLQFQWLSWRALSDVDVVINCGRVDYLPLIALTKVPLIVWFHNPVRQGELDYVNLIRKTRWSAIFVSDSQAKPLRGLGWRRTIHNAVDVAFMKPDESAAPRTYAVFLGRLTVNKGVDLAIDVARRAGVYLKIAGNISDETGAREYFETIVRPELGNGCEWVGEVDDVQKRKLLQGACALLFPIKWVEPFGIVMAESLACGTPVIALRRASVPEVVREGENGFSCANVDEMVTALKNVGAISRARCRADAVARFGPRLFHERTLAAIEDARMANRSKGPRPDAQSRRGEKVPRKLLIIVDPQIPVPPRLYGGTERIAATLCGGLQEAGWGVRLMAGAGSRNYGGGLSIHRAPSKARASRIFRKLLFIYRSLKAARGCDAVINFGRTDYLEGLLRTQVPVVCRFGNPVRQAEINFVNRRRRGRKSFVFISEDQRRELTGADPSRVVYNAVDSDRYSPNDRPVAERDYFLFLGRLTRNKGIHLAIEAARRTHSRLIIAGNISDEPGGRQLFEQVVQPALGPRCEWVGPVDDFKKRMLLRDARAMLFPIQWREPFGIVMAESLACGTPVIAFRNGSVPEVIEHRETGFVCDSMGEMCDAMRGIDSISHLRCREAALRRFSPAPFLEGMIAAVDAATGGNL